MSDMVGNPKTGFVVSFPLKTWAAQVVNFGTTPILKPISFLPYLFNLGAARPKSCSVL